MNKTVHNRQHNAKNHSHKSVNCNSSRTSHKTSDKAKRHQTKSSRSVSAKKGYVVSASKKRASLKVMENRKRAFMNSMKKAILTVVCLSFLIGAYTIAESLYFSPAVVKAEEHLSEIQYKVIQIQYGDTLWSIAKENMNPGFHDINEYINEIMLCNQMHTDRINEGCYLMIPYYDVLTCDVADAGTH